MNVVVIVTDSLRADHVGCYGSSVATPNLDELATEGALFLNAYSENLPTLPTRRAWWTGKYHFYRAGWQPFENSDYLLAEVLWDRGWTTALITDTYHMHKPVYNCGRGFDTVVWVRGQEYDPWVVDPNVHVDVDASPAHRLKSGTGRESNDVWRSRYAQYLRNRSRMLTEMEYCTPHVIDRASRWLDEVVEERKDRIFLWVDLFDPHEPWDPPDPYKSLYRDPAYRGPDLVDPVPGFLSGYMTADEVANTKSLYAAEVTMVDHWIGKLFDRLKQLGLWENTLTVHVADHGEPFGEHGYIRKAYPRGYQELVHVPWIMRHPEGLGRGRRIDGLVQTVDLMPTLLGLMEIDASDLSLTYTEPRQSGRSRNIFPQDLPSYRKRTVLTGKNLVPLLTNEVQKVREFVFGGHYGREWFIKDEEWSCLLPIDGSRPAELYHLQSDPMEQVNLIATHPEQAAHMELAVHRFIRELDVLERKETEA